MSAERTTLSPEEANKRTKTLQQLVIARAEETCDSSLEALDRITMEQAHIEPPSSKTLADFAEPPPEKDNPNALFANGYLRKGGAVMLVSSAGTGKSAFSIQSAILWAMGKPCFGIVPVRPLKIVIIQAEDDDEEIAQFRNEISAGLVEEGGVMELAVHVAWRQIHFLDFTGKTGLEFCNALSKFLRENPDVDLVVMNPLQSFLGADLNRNADLSEFFRTWLDPIIKQACPVGMFIVHHTNKPPNAKERKGWGVDEFSAYVGAGGAELVNWARAMLALMPCEGQPGVFRLVAGKRGGRLDWSNIGGVRQRLIAHSEKRIYWREATSEEYAKAGTGQTGTRAIAKTPEQDAEELARALRRQPLQASAARARIKESCGKRRGDAAFEYLKEHLDEFNLAAIDCRFKGAVFYGEKVATKAAADEFDARCQKTRGARA